MGDNLKGAHSQREHTARYRLLTRVAYWRWRGQWKGGAREYVAGTASTKCTGSLEAEVVEGEKDCLYEIERNTLRNLRGWGGVIVGW